MYINVRIMDMDVMIPEQICKCCDNGEEGYTIFLNARHTQERRMQAYKHAMNHIENGNFEKENVQEIELEAHNE